MVVGVRGLWVRWMGLGLDGNQLGRQVAVSQSSMLAVRKSWMCACGVCRCV